MLLQLDFPLEFLLMSKPEVLSLKVFFIFMGRNDLDNLGCFVVLQVFQTVMFMTLCW